MLIMLTFLLKSYLRDYGVIVWIFIEFYPLDYEWTYHIKKHYFKWSIQVARSSVLILFQWLYKHVIKLVCTRSKYIFASFLSSSINKIGLTWTFSNAIMTQVALSFKSAELGTQRAITIHAEIFTARFGTIIAWLASQLLIGSDIGDISWISLYYWMFINIVSAKIVTEDDAKTLNRNLFTTNVDFDRLQFS